jgi:DNA ligase D-like protein (predicted ligase)
MFTEPMECLPVTKLPEGPQWVYELKLDGYRMQAISDSKGVRLLSRRGNDFTGHYAAAAAALRKSLKAGTAIDGEIVALDGHGQPNFNLLQNAKPQTPVVFFAFDVLMHGWKDLIRLPFSARASIVPETFTPADNAQLVVNFPGPADKFAAAVRKMNGEGVVAKRLDSVYEPGRRTGAWVKMRLNLGQEFVIGGFTPGTHGIESLLVGLYYGDELRYVARVRAGFVQASRRAVYDRLRPLIVGSCPFVNLPETSRGRWGEGITAEKMRGCVWVRPEAVGRFEFLEWTDSEHVRHIRFIELRDDKNPATVVRET